MAIKILSELTASPNPTTLPRRIHLKHRLQSTRDSETITVIYTLDGGATAIRFLDAQKQPVTRVERSETITAEADVCENRIFMDGRPDGAFENLEITKTIVPRVGNPRQSVAILTVNAIPR